MGMVGGGEGAFIGAVHRHAALLDGGIELVCGTFSADPDKSRRSGSALGLPQERVYGSYAEMMRVESAMDPSVRMQFVAIVTPNHLHYPVADCALEHGFHVLCDKPATLNLAEAIHLKERVAATRLQFGLTHTYLGYPLVQEARSRIAAGSLGAIRKVLVQYSQGWLAKPLEQTDNKQAKWRLDPAQAGLSSCMGDIGVHAFNLAEYISGLQVTQICADLTSFVDGRNLDDDGSVLLRFDNGAKGVLTASQVSVGEENGLAIQIYGDKAGLKWSQQEPNTLWFLPEGEPVQMLRTGGDYLSSTAGALTRTPMGHPEGYIEAFANLYKDFAAQVAAPSSGTPSICPGIEAGCRGMAFIELTVTSSQSDIKWHDLV
ncbi:MAG: Gfo/Idh/MocA family oxidoreductase [Pseudomonadota bacterium]